MSGSTLSAIGVLLAVVVGGTAGARSSREPSTKIAFSCTGDICTVNADGSARRRLTYDKWIDSYPAWSPDGRRIAFTGNLGRNVIYVMNADGTDRRRLTPRRGSDAFPAWSPDGRTIAFDNDVSGEIDLMSPDGTRRRRLTRESASLPTWSPDGKRIAFVSGNGRKIALTSGDIYVIDADGSGRRLLTRDGTFPAWSPDGQRIAFIRNRTRWSKNVAIWVVNADGSGEHRLRSDSEEGGGLSWSPDGTRIAFTSDSAIYTTSADGGDLREVARSGDNHDPAWQPARSAR
jgi:TolB protein